MTDFDYYKKTDEVISKFKNGKERFNTSPTFNRVVQMLVRDVDPIDIIDQLITINDDTQRAFSEHLMRYGNSMFNKS